MSMHLNEVIKNFFRDKHILITGSSGYIASRLVDYLGTIDCAITRMSRKKLPALNTNATIIDVCEDLSAFLHWETLLKSVDIVFHLAAQTAIKAADDNPALDADINITPTIRLLDAAKKLGGKIIIAASSATAFGLSDQLPVSEKMPDAPCSIYDLHKIMVENYLHFFVKKNWVRGTALRLSNVYGPGVKSSDASRSVLNQIAQKSVNGEAIFYINHGEFLRDYIFLDDVVMAFLYAATYNENLSQPYYLIGSGVGITLKTAFKTVIDTVQKEKNVSTTLQNKIVTNAPPIDERQFIANSTLFSSVTGWQPQINFQEGVKRLVLSCQPDAASL